MSVTAAYGTLLLLGPRQGKDFQGLEQMGASKARRGVAIEAGGCVERQGRTRRSS